MNIQWTRLVLIAFACVLVSACATQPETASYDPPGFLLGLFHGFTILFSLVGSLFTEYRVYAFPNSGILYDFGFFLGATTFLGGSAAST